MEGNIEFIDNKSSKLKSNNRLLKKVMLWSVPVVIIWTIITFLIFDEPGSGMIALLFFFPVMPIIYIFYPLYFVILSVRYSRERSSMDLLDKIMFYILMAAIVPLGVFAVYKVGSDNVIQKLIADHKQNIEKKSIQIDLVAKDISFEYIGNLKVKFCNDSENSPNFYTKHFSIKVETDKKAEFTFPSIIFPPESGKCDERWLTLKQLGLNEGDVANITASIDPENKINETNKENNKMTKNITFGKVSGDCFDTDEGKDYYKKGMATISGTGVGDCCRESLADGPCLPQSQHLIEGYCENGKPLGELYECPKGCADGVCIK